MGCSRWKICTVGCGVSCTFVGIVVVLIVFGGNQKMPSFQVLDFQLSGLDETLASQVLIIMAKSTFAIEAMNRGKHMDIKYGTFTVSVRTQHEDVELGKGTVPGFHQSSKNRSTVIHGNLTSADLEDRNLNQEQRLRLVLDRNLRKLQLVIVMQSETRYNKRGLEAARQKVVTAEVHCKIDIDPQITNGNQVFWKECELMHFGCSGSKDDCNNPTYIPVPKT